MAVVAAVVLMVMVVTPPAESDAGEKEQVALLPAGGVQPKLTEPWKPPMRFIWMATFALVRPVSVRVEGTMLRT